MAKLCTQQVMRIGYIVTKLGKTEGILTEEMERKFDNAIREELEQLAIDINEEIAGDLPWLNSQP